jgi:RNA polymerase sigma factor (sigma-70 family)
VAIDQVMSGETLLSPDLAAQVLRRVSQELSREVSSVPERLTPRESDVIQLVAKGMTNRQIADTLSISPGTVKIHVERIIGKLGVSDRTQAAVRAVEAGIVGPSSR